MHAYTRLVRHAMVPAMDLLRGTRTAMRIKELEESQWWSSERHHESQAAALQALVRYAFERVPYYRRLVAELELRPEDITTPEDLCKLPLLTKDIIHENLPDLLADDYPRRQLRSSWTGGTTGSRMHFYTTRDNQLSWALPRWVRSMGMQGFTIGDPHVSISQMIARRKPFLERLTHSFSNRFQRVTRLDSMDVTEENLEGMVKAIERAAPCTLAGYPSSLAMLAQFIKDSGRRPPRIVASMVGGEQLLPHQRAIMQEMFGNEPYLRYGSNELLEAAAECPAREGLHISVEDFIVEVVNEHDQPVPDGQEGRLVFTNLRSYGMPFIRYAIGDIGSQKQSQCSCGRTLPLLDPIVARTIDYLYSRDGRRIAPMQLDMSPVIERGITQFRIVQRDYDHVSVVLVPRAGDGQPGDPAVIAQSTERILKSYLGEGLAVSVRFADRIEMNISGKRLAVMSQIPGVSNMQ